MGSSVGSSPPASPDVQQTSQPSAPASIQAAAAPAGPKSASSGWPTMTMNRFGRHVCAVAVCPSSLRLDCLVAGTSFAGGRRPRMTCCAASEWPFASCAAELSCRPRLRSSPHGRGLSVCRHCTRPKERSRRLLSVPNPGSAATPA